jgi:endo-1,4-beta-xylanase
MIIKKILKILFIVSSIFFLLSFFTCISSSPGDTDNADINLIKEWEDGVTACFTFERDTYINKWLSDSSLFSSKLSDNKRPLLETTADPENPGNQVLKISGKIDNSIYSSLGINLDIYRSINESFIDFSTKIIKLSVFVPPGSAIDYLTIGMWHDNNYVVTGGQYVKQGEWNEVIILIKYIYEFNNVEYTHTWFNADRSLTTEETREVISNCSILEIKGQRNRGGIKQNTFFYVDNLQLAEMGDEYDIYNLTVDDSRESLRKYAESKGLIIGVAIDNPYVIFENFYAETLINDFNCIVPGYVLKWYITQPEEGRFDFTQSDLLLDFAKNYHLFFRGHTLGWHASYTEGLGGTQFVPEWLEKKKYSELKSCLEYYIEKVMGHYKGEIYAWDVFNEVIKEDGSGLRNNNEPSGSWEYSIWADNKNDDSIIKAAFIKARSVDPWAKLFLNDYDTEEIGSPKAEKFYELVAGWVEEGVPIDGVGFQLHLKEEAPINMEKFRQNIERFVALGLEIHFTEIDVRVFIDDIDLMKPEGREILSKRFEHQAEIYAELIQIALDYQNITTFIIWGLTDKYSWIIYTPFFPGYDYALIFDKTYEPKPAYYYLLDILKG